MSVKKLRGKTTNILNYYFSNKFTLWYIRLNNYIMENKIFLSIYSTFIYLEIQRRLIRAYAYFKHFCSVWKEASHKSLKMAAAKKLFPSVCIIDTICFDEFFLFYVTARRYYFLYKFIGIQRFGTAAMLRRSLRQMF